MDSSWPENMSSDRKRAIEKLLRGREFTNQLQNLLRSKPLMTKYADHGLVSAEDLLLKISGSFTDTLSILNSGESDEVSQNPAASWDGRKSEDSGDSSRSRISTLKDRRGCYKRRKNANSWTSLSPTLVDDGHAWRKYGQKVILNAKHPRNYFRCTHKHDQGCQATKQVQKTEDDPTMYRITYNGQHTCKIMLKSPQMIFDSNRGSDDQSSSIFLSFGSNISTEENDENPSSLFPSFPQIIKKESKDHIDHEDVPPTSNDHYNQRPPSSDYILSPDLTTFESSGHMTVMSSPLGSSDYGDAISEMRSSASLDMDLIIGMVTFEDDVMQFEF